MAEYTDLRGARVLITGGAQGIGAAMVRGFHAQGSEVFFCDLENRAGELLARDLGNRASFTRVDLANEKQIVRWIKKIAAAGQPIRALINNAARDPRIPFSAMTSAQWDDLFATNIRAYFLAAREAARHMCAGSAIVNFSSITFHTAPAEMVAYVATKAAALGFTRSLAREFGPRGIRVNALSPGWIMTERQLKQFVTPRIKKLICRSQCIPELLVPDDIAQVALFLASDASRALTGQEILADRGWAYS
jgi:NAD(P)-dependent dehydrogenase (short-subunit alcohol dehydrogenase family)